MFGECSEGVGAPEFAARLKGLSTYGGFLKEIETAPVGIDQWQLEKLAMAGSKVETLFHIPGLRREATGGLADRVFPTPAKAIEALLHGLPRHATVAVIPEGPYVFAQPRQDAAMTF